MQGWYRDAKTAEWAAAYCRATPSLRRRANREGLAFRADLLAWSRKALASLDTEPHLSRVSSVSSRRIGG